MPSPDARVLDLHECARFRARLEHRAGAKVTERPDEAPRADRGVVGDHVGADSRPSPTVFRPRRTVNGPTGVGLELDDRLDPRRRRVDDRDAREHVRLVDPVAECGGGGGELDARVHALGSAVVGATARHALAGRRRGAATASVR